MQYKFHLNNLRVAPRKVRAVINVVKKMSALEAEAQLKFSNKRAAMPVLKLLKSAIASAVNNFNLAAENLYVSNILVDQGPMLKRFRPRAFGRANAIHKHTSHLTLILEEKVMPGKERTKKGIIKEAKPKMVVEKKAAETLPAAPKKEAPKEIKPKRKLEGITRRIFRRKAIG